LIGEAFLVYLGVSLLPEYLDGRNIQFVAQPTFRTSFSSRCEPYLSSYTYFRCWTAKLLVSEFFMLHILEIHSWKEFGSFIFGINCMCCLLCVLISWKAL